MSSVLIVQAASTKTFHCFGDGKYFDDLTAGHAMRLEGVRGAHLMSSGRTPARQCLIVEPTLRVLPDNGNALAEFIHVLARHLGYDDVELARPVERRDAGLARDLDDWLTLAS